MVSLLTFNDPSAHVIPLFLQSVVANEDAEGVGSCLLDRQNVLV